MQRQIMENLRGKIKEVRGQFLKALPVICFFLALYYSVILLFGLNHVMVASLVTVVFQVNYRKHLSVKALLRLAVQQLIVEGLAFLATLNLPLCILLNLAVPFWLIFTKASQFNQLGYFSTLMTFTFLQMMPVGWEEIGTQVQAMVYSLSVFILITYIYSKWEQGGQAEHPEQRGFLLLSQMVEHTVREEEADGEWKELFQIQKRLYQQAGQKRGRKRVVTSEGKISYMLALLFQRSVYFASNQYREMFLQDPGAREMALRLAAYMKEAGETDLWEDNTEALEQKGRKLLREVRHQKAEFYHSVTNFLQLFLLILQQIHLGDPQIMDDRWEIPLWHRIKSRFLYKMKPDTFEMRFALRMSTVLIIGMSYTMITQVDHGYWLVMNAFLLLRPMYEESRYRMKTRFIGTAAGCVIMILVLGFLEADTAHLLFAGVMAVCMYTATPGTRIHAVFVTCFAMAMTTLAMGNLEALWLRMLYVAAAVLLVLVVNQYFFPTSLWGQYHYNWEILFHMHHVYLRLLEDALVHPLDYWKICDAQIQYFLVYSQIEQHLPKLPEGERRHYQKTLGICWRMSAEMEQMLFLVGQKRRGVQARQQMCRYIDYTDEILDQIQSMLHLKKEKQSTDLEGKRYQRYIEGERELSMLMTRYGKNLSRLYVVVSRKYQG